MTSPILNEVERRERLSMKEEGGEQSEDDGKTKKKGTSSTTADVVGDKNRRQNLGIPAGG